MTQIINTDIRTALIEGSESGKALNYAHDFTDLLGNVQNARGFFQTLEDNLTPTDDGDNLEISQGVAFVKYTKTSGEIGFLKFNLTTDLSIDLSAESDGTFYCFVELDSDAVDNGSGEIDGSDVATLKVDSSLPASGDYLEICSLVKSGTSLAITDLREMVKLSMGELSLGEQKIPHSKIHEFGISYSSDSLSVTVNGGVYKEDGTSNSDTNLTLSASNTNYIDLNINTGTVASNTSGFSGIALYAVTTSASGVAAVVDKRQAFIGSQGGGEVANAAEAIAGTDDTKFISPLKARQILDNDFPIYTGTTTNTSETEIFLGGVADTRMTLEADSVSGFVADITARTANGKCAFWKIEGAIKRDNSGNTELVGENTKTLVADEVNRSLDEDLFEQVNSFTVSAQAASSNTKYVTFNDDGTIMYVGSNDNTAIYQYSLSTAWDVSTASYDSKSFSVSGLGSELQSLSGSMSFSDDGTKLYVSGTNYSTNNKIWQCSLSTAWDISTASYASKELAFVYSVGSMRFHANGTKMITIEGNKFREYTLSTAWDISTASNTATSSTIDTYIYSFDISSDGKKIWTLYQYNTSYAIKTYSLSTAWDITTTSLDETLAIGSMRYRCCFSGDFTRFYATDLSTIYEYRIGNYVSEVSDCAVEADDTNEALVVKVSGEDSTNVDWRAKIFGDLNRG